MIDAAYEAWRADRTAGRSSILISDSNESVAALNSRARTDLIFDGTVRGPREATLHDDSRAAIGDTVITRKNDRRLVAGRGWVRNGDRWTLLDVRTDGAVVARRLGATRGCSVVLPAAYVAEHLELGYAVTSYRAQGVTTDTAHVLVDSSMTRENLYVAMTRGRDVNRAYVAVDQPDSLHSGPHPGDDDGATGRSVLHGVLQNVGAELSAHESLVAEQERWGTIAQLAAEYEAIAAAAQRDRWESLLRTPGLSEDEAAAAIDSDAFGPLTAELRRAEASHHDVDVLLPRLVRARGFNDADDVAAVLRHRVAAATARAAGSGRSRKAPRLIVGLIPEATGVMSDEMRTALEERRTLMEARADAVLDRGLSTGAPWASYLGAQSVDARSRASWRRSVRVIAAYRDRYQVTSDTTLGAPPEDTNQRVHYARADADLKALARQGHEMPTSSKNKSLGASILRI